MASPQPPARTVAVTAGVGIAALLTAAATALPAVADPPGNGAHGNSANAPGHSRSHDDGTSDGNSSGKSRGKANGHDKQNGAVGSGNSATGGSNAQPNGPATGHNPPGNNGTVFIHDVAGDEHPHNVPHVACTFYVDFFNFDNSQTVTVSFAGQAPTGMGTALGGTTTKTLEADDASGAGHDWDGELAFTADQLGVSALGTPAHQGYHVKMTVDTNEPGGHKYKVFWIEPCGATGSNTQPTAESGQSTSNSTSATPTESASTSAQSAPTTGGQSTSGALAPAQAERANGVPTEVLGTKLTRSGSTPAAGATSAASLPFTGAEIGAMTLAAIAALGGGAVLTVAGRRRRRGTASR